MFALDEQRLDRHIINTRLPRASLTEQNEARNFEQIVEGEQRSLLESARIDIVEIAVHGRPTRIER